MENCVSIIICTRNRAESLRQTLGSVLNVYVPNELVAELIIVDNGSTDETEEVIGEVSTSKLAVQHVYVESPGQSIALNHAISQANGQILLFTDDDVRVPRMWVKRMTGPLFAGEADAIAGGVRLPPHLQRDWMRHTPTAILALSDSLDPERPARFIGANMALHRRVFDLIPQFDEELGPGRLGLEGETLLALQMRQAGLRIRGALDVTVEHHLDSSRLKHFAFRNAMERLGRSMAYMGYHWRHEEGGRLRSLLGMAKAAGELVMRRMVTRTPEEGMPGWEQDALRRYYYHKQMLTEAGRPRNYLRRGLRKVGGKVHPKS